MGGPIYKMSMEEAAAGGAIRVEFPPLDEQARRDRTKMVRGVAEGCKVAVRNCRRDALAGLKTLAKDQKISADEKRQGADQLQKLTDQFIKDIDQAVEVKEKELLTI